MSLPETIWLCEKHDALSPSKNGPCHQAHVMAYRAGGNPFEPNRCRKHMVEVELHPVGSRVAGPDDLLIRRGDSIPDALVDEAAKRLRAKSGIRLFDYETIDEIDDLARAALGVLFPGEEEE